MKKEINSIEYIHLLVDSFYERVRKDEVLAPIFNEKIKEWPHHLDIMYRFWQTLLLNQNTYNGTPFLKHQTLPIEKEHFERWLTLFHETVDTLYSGNIAVEAKYKAGKIGEVFQHKLGLS
jgi:hemoglobin